MIYSSEPNYSHFSGGSFFTSLNMRPSAQQRLKCIYMLILIRKRLFTLGEIIKVSGRVGEWDNFICAQLAAATRIATCGVDIYALCLWIIAQRC